MPVAVLLVSPLHFITDAEKPAEITSSLREAMALGSYLVMVHGTREGQPRETAVEKMYERSTASGMTLRSRAEIAGLFDGFSMVEPGHVTPSMWRPEQTGGDGDTEKVWLLAGVGQRAG